MTVLALIRAPTTALLCVILSCSGYFEKHDHRLLWKAREKAPLEFGRHLKTLSEDSVNILSDRDSVSVSNTCMIK